MSSDSLCPIAFLLNILQDFKKRRISLIFLPKFPLDLVMYESTHPFNYLFECGRSDEDWALSSDFLKNAPSQNEMADNDNDGNGATFLVRQ